MIYKHHPDYQQVRGEWVWNDMFIWLKHKAVLYGSEAVCFPPYSGAKSRVDDDIQT